jgi:hypothetical protein
MPYNGKKWTLGNNGPGSVEKRTNTGPNHPKTALLLLGHGGEGLYGKTNTVVVPKGSIVVIKSHSGDVRIVKDLKNNMRQLLDNVNTKYLLDPVKYIGAITRLFGSVAIYREGDVCPNLVNSRFLSWNYEHTLKVLPSGLIKLPLENSQYNAIGNLYKFIESTVEIPKTMTVKAYLEQKDRPDGINLDSLFRLAVLKNFKPFLPELEKYLIEEVRLDPERLLVHSLKYLEEDTTTDVSKMLNSLKAPAVLYFFTCRYIDNHENYVPESVRLGTNNTSGIITNREKEQVERPVGQTANNSHLKQYLRAIGKTSTIKKNNSVDRHLITKSALERATFGFHNRNRNVATKRARVSKAAPEIQRQISESVLQRRLGAKAYAEIHNGDSSNLVYVYSNVLSNKNGQKEKLDRLKRVYPDIEKDFIDSLVNKDISFMTPYDKYETVNKLKQIRGSYLNRKNDIDAAIEKYGAV